jgi:hypothetical protein
LCPLVFAILLLFFLSSSVAEDPFVFDKAFYREGEGIYIDTIASPIAVRGQALRFRWGYDRENISVPYKFATMPFWIEHDLPFPVDLCDGSISFKTTFPMSTYINWDYDVFEPNYRNEVIDEPCVEPFDGKSCFIDSFESYELVFCDVKLDKDVCSHTIQVEDGTYTTITRSHPVALSDLHSCPLEKGRRYNLYHYAEIPLGEQIVFDVSLELSLPLSLERATFVIPAPSWTSTTANDYNAGNAYDFNWTKVTWDGNIMPTGDDRIHNDQNQAFYDQNLLMYYRFNDLNSTGALINDTNYAVYNKILGSGTISRNWGMWDTNTYYTAGSGHSINTTFTGNDLNEMTISVWVNSEYLVGPRYFADNSNGSTGFGFRHVAAQIDFFTFTGGAATVASKAGILDGNRWHHIVGVHDTTSNKVYFDGMLVATLTLSAGQGIDDSAGTMHIGGDYIAGSGFLGSIDEFKLYDRALSAAEIQADYNSWMHSNYFSPVKDAGAAVNWDAMDWNAFVDVNNSVTVDYRGCSAADCSTAGAWMGGFKSKNSGNTQTNIYADGNRYFQYRLSFDTNKQQWNGVRSPAIADGDKGRFGHFSNVVVVYSTISGEDSCSCPASGHWNIVNGDVCTLSTTCNLSAGSLHIFNGSLYITSTGILNVPTGYKIIIEKTNSKLVVVKPTGKVIINK